jgi:hypothetical protein
VSELSSRDGNALAGRSSTDVGSRLWFGDIKRVLLTNLLSYGGACWLVTVTAPGADLLPWDEASRKVEPHAAHEWNRSAQRRWSELHRRAVQATRRAGHDVSSLARVWQMQSRGVLHLHLVLGVESLAERTAARHYVAELRARSREFGFGYIDAVDRDGKSGKSRVMEPHRAAGYLSRYLGESSQLAEAIALEDRPRRLVWVSPSLTRSTKCTMRRLRRARFLYWIRRGDSSVLALARRSRKYGGSLFPAWMRDSAEHRAVAQLLRSPVLTSGP